MRSAAAMSSAIGFSTSTCLPAFRRRDRHRFVLPRGGADIDQIDVRIGEQVFVSGMSMNWAEVHDLAGRAEVATDGSPIAGKFFRVAGVNGRHRGAGEALGGEIMNHAHEADAGEADADHWRSLRSQVSQPAKTEYRSTVHFVVSASWLVSF